MHLLAVRCKCRCAMSTVRSVFASFLASATVVLFVSGASAQDAKVEAAAKALQKKAIQSDYLGRTSQRRRPSSRRRSPTAEPTSAAPRCAPSSSATSVRPRRRRRRRAAGIKAFQEALKLDPKIELDPDLKTGDIEKAFEKAKSGGGATSGGGDDKTVSAGDFSHTPVAEQAIRTPLPIYAEYTGSEALTRVIARYRAPGMGEWKTLELKKIDKGWGAELACLDVQPGVISYYLQGFNAERSRRVRRRPQHAIQDRDQAVDHRRQAAPARSAAVQPVRRHRRLPARFPRLQGRWLRGSPQRGRRALRRGQRVQEQQVRCR